MDNDDKMKNENTLPESMSKEHRSEVMLFLKDELQPLSHDKPHSYDLETEYAKTRKNRPTYIWVVMALSFVVVGLVTFGISRLVDYNNDKIKVNIDVFNDLNLRNLLDIVSQTKTKQDGATRELSRLQAELSYGQKQAEQELEADLYTLQSLKLGPIETIRQKKKIQEEYNKTLHNLHETYDVQIATQENLIEQYQQQLADYDSSKVAQAQQQEAAIDSTKQLYEIEKRQIQAKHEQEIANLRNQLTKQQQNDFENQKTAVREVTTKYQKEIDSLDPVVKGYDELLTRAQTSTHSQSSELLSLIKQLPPNVSEEYRTTLNDAVSSYADFAAAQQVVAGIPQKNSVPDFVKAMAQLTYHTGNSVVAASVAEVNRLANQSPIQTQTTQASEAGGKEGLLQEQVTQYENCLASMCQINEYDGILLAFSKTIKMPVYVTEKVRAYFMDPSYAGMVVKGTINRKNAKIASATILLEDGQYYCRTDDVSAAGRLRIGDYIIVDKPQVGNTTVQ